MRKVVSDDSARRGLKKIDEADGVDWLQTHLQRCYEPLLTQDWILDADVTVKPLYGHQEGAEKGYNPHKPGRPSQAYHTYMIAEFASGAGCRSSGGKPHGIHVFGLQAYGSC